jgi:hypothetical protein
VFQRRLDVAGIVTGSNAVDDNTGLCRRQEVSSGRCCRVLWMLLCMRIFPTARQQLAHAASQPWKPCTPTADQEPANYRRRQTSSLQPSVVHSHYPTHRLPARHVVSTRSFRDPRCDLRSWLTRTQQTRPQRPSRHPLALLYVCRENNIGWMLRMGRQEVVRLRRMPPRAERPSAHADV